ITTFTKLVMNVIRRMVYPFAPAFARGLSVDLTAITSLIAVNQATALLGPVGASFADRYGHKLLMLVALALATIGSFAAGIIPMYAVLMICLFLAGLAKNIFDPSLQAFIGNHVPYEHRGKFIGITEIAWAGTTLAGIPLAGILIERFSWQTPFLVLSALTLVSFFLILKFMPSDRASARATNATRPGMAASWKTIVKNRQVLGMLGFVFSMSLANDCLFVVYGAWLEQSYGLSLSAIGFGTILIGLSELFGEGCTALFADRIGLVRAVVIGTALSALAYLALPATDIGLPFVLSGLFMLFFFFEFTIVTSMSLNTELVPALRASTMSAFYMMGGIGRVIGAFAGGIIWKTYGLTGISLTSGGFTLLALIAILAGFSGRKGKSS
ncbi:MAG TPA: MFS transporter, partial [Desulfobacteraceae bacterium]|nr:MFS transporter [Desulfobacteraceae bacterium]